MFTGFSLSACILVFSGKYYVCYYYYYHEIVHRVHKNNTKIKKLKKKFKKSKCYYGQLDFNVLLCLVSIRNVTIGVWCVAFQLDDARQTVSFELETLDIRPDPEPLLVEMIHAVRGKNFFSKSFCLFFVTTFILSKRLTNTDQTQSM